MYFSDIANCTYQILSLYFSDIVIVFLRYCWLFFSDIVNVSLRYCWLYFFDIVNCISQILSIVFPRYCQLYFFDFCEGRLLQSIEPGRSSAYIRHTTNESTQNFPSWCHNKTFDIYIFTIWNIVPLINYFDIWSLKIR